MAYKRGQNIANQDIFDPNNQTSPITSTTPEEAEAPKKPDFYRFNAKFPIECKAYLQEMSWRNRMTITDYVTKIIKEDMERHPEWVETIDLLNKT